jgi:hypothetical protein
MGQLGKVDTNQPFDFVEAKLDFLFCEVHPQYTEQQRRWGNSDFPPEFPLLSAPFYHLLVFV